MQAKYLTAGAILVLTACGPTIRVTAPDSADLAGEAVPGDAAHPPETPAGSCWGRDTLPAVIETRTETRQLPDGSWRSESHQRIVQDRRQVWIRTPCYDTLTPDTILVLQRALRARGYYLGPDDRTLSPETMTALRRWQADHGLDTRVLSLKAAQTLGLVPTPL